MIIGYEINRPFAYWYGEPEVFPANALKTIHEALPAEPQEAMKALEALKKRILEYVEAESPPQA